MQDFNDFVAAGITTFDAAGENTQQPLEESRQLCTWSMLHC
jgi:hypothetical protein